jgi:hypothetical protein
MEGSVGVVPVILTLGSNGGSQFQSPAELTSYALNWSLGGHRAAPNALKKKICCSCRESNRDS